MGPLMFILYINDISEGTSSSIKLFADDCILFRVIRSVQDSKLLQYDLDKLCEWASVWQMSFNASKCSVLTVTKKQKPIVTKYNMLGVELKHYDHHPYLGVELSRDLSWGPHIKQTTSKAQGSLNLLRRNLHGCSQLTKARAYTTMVRPILEYAGTVWDPFHNVHIRSLEAVQRRAARWTLQNYSREASVTDMLNTLEWRPLQERRCINRLTMFYKTVHLKTACIIPQWFPPTTHAYASRASHQLQYGSPNTNSDTYRLSFFPRTVRTWNILPVDIVLSPSQDIFKNQLQQCFLDGRMFMVPPKDLTQTPRLGCTSSVSRVGAMI